MNKGVGNVEEEVQPETENIQASVSVDTGGVFWINSLEKECRQCGEEFQTPKRTIRGDGSWRNRRAVVEGPIQTSNRFSNLEVAEEEQREQWKEEDHSLRTGISKVILAMSSDSPKGEGIRGQIVVDPGAADSVLPRFELDQAFPLVPKRENMRFVAANVQTINHYGRRHVAFRTDGRTGINCMAFHVIDAKKALASVGKMVEQGNSVHFTPTGSYIEGPKGERVELRKEGGVYVMDVDYLPGFRGQV